MSLAVDNKPEGFLPPGHVDKGGEVYHAPIKGHEHIGLGGIEVSCYPEGVIGSPTKADPEKGKELTDSDRRLLYVASTRARKHLDFEDCAAVADLIYSR